MTDIQKRFDRILGIYLYLQTKTLVTAQELAEKYEVSLRTIYRDIRSLIAAGVPIYGEAGQGYALVSGYKMPPVQFSREEALSFLTAEKLMEKFTDKQLAQNFATALHKIKAVLRSAEKQHVANADDRLLLIRRQDHAFNEGVPNGLNVLMESIIARRCVAISYLKPSETQAERRTIEPIGVFIDGNFWYVLGYCRLRQDIRQFRLDRMRSIALSEEGFSNEYRELSYYLNKPEAPKLDVVIEVDRAIARYLHWDRGHFGFVKEEIAEDRVVMYFKSAHIDEAFARWCLMFADKIDVIEPPVLREKIRELLDESMRRMS